MHNKFSTKKVIIFHLIFLSTAFAQLDTVVAKVGNEKISIKEFKERFELTPQVKKKNSTLLEDKKSDFLFSLIAEKLWALEAENRGLDTSEIMKSTFSYIEKMLVSEKLYENEITANVKVNEEELLLAMKRNFIDLEIRTIHYKDSSKIYDAYVSLLNGAAYDSIFNMQPVPLPDILISYGELDPKVENELFNLNEGEYSKPIFSGSEWLIFQIKNRIEKSYTSKDINESISKVDALIRQRKSDSIYADFYKNFFKDKKVEVNGDLFWLLSDGISEILTAKKSEENLADTSIVYFTADNLLNLEKKINGKLSENFLEFEKYPVKVKEFLRYFIFDGFYTRATDKETIAAKFNSRVKNIIESELLSREAYSRGLRNSPEVNAEINTWRENYLSKILKNIIIDSIKISDEEVSSYFKEATSSGNKIVEVNIVEILTDSLSVVEEVLDQLNNGADIRQLALEHTKREWTKNNNGEFGFFPTTMYGNIGKIAGQIEAGEVYGPLKVDEGYSVFKLIDKREEKSKVPAALEGSKKIVMQKKLSEAFINYTSKLADKYNIEINRNVLDQINVNDYKMFAIRNFGFGGKLTAVPLTIPFSEWFEEWSKSRDNMQ